MAREVFSDYLKRLGGLGLEKLGKGATATVFQHPHYESVAVKVGLAKPDSQGYEWLQWCSRHRNLWTPDVYTLEELDTELPSGKQGRMFIAFMERLDRADPKVIRKFFASHPLLFPKLERSFWGFNPDAIKPIKDAEMKKALVAINKFKHCDFKLENVMLRGEQIVFSDPVY